MKECQLVNLNFNASIQRLCPTYTPSSRYFLIYLFQIGSLNKIPITVLGFLVFNAKMTHQGIMYISMASLGGLMYGYSKLPQS